MPQLQPVQQINKVVRQLSRCESRLAAGSVCASACWGLCLFLFAFNLVLLLLNSHSLALTDCQPWQQVPNAAPAGGSQHQSAQQPVLQGRKQAPAQRALQVAAQVSSEPAQRCQCRAKPCMSSCLVLSSCTNLSSWQQHLSFLTAV